MATDKSTPLSRRWLYLPFAFAGLIFFAYFLLWRAGATEMERHIDQWVAAQRQAGFDITHGEIRTHGFPFFLRAQIDRPAIASPAGWRWRSERLFLDALPYALDRLVFSPDGEQEIYGAALGEWRGQAEQLRASIERDAVTGWRFALTVSDAEGRRPQDGAAYSLTALTANIAPAADDPGALTLNLLARDFILSLNGSMARERAIVAAKTEAALAVTQSALMGEASLWRAAGGTLSIAHFHLNIEDANITAKGRLTLDDDDYPAGRVDATIEQPAGAAHLLGKAGLLPPDQADAAAAGLTLAAIAGGGKITGPIILEDGAARLGGIKLAELKPLR